MLRSCKHRLLANWLLTFICAGFNKVEFERVCFFFSTNNCLLELCECFHHSIFFHLFLLAPQHQETTMPWQKGKWSRSSSVIVIGRNINLMFFYRLWPWRWMCVQPRLKRVSTDTTLQMRKRWSKPICCRNQKWSSRSRAKDHPPLSHPTIPLESKVPSHSLPPTFTVAQRSLQTIPSLGAKSGRM